MNAKLCINTCERLFYSCLIAAVLVVVLVQSEAKVLRDLDDLTDDDFGVETQLEELGEDEVASEKRLVDILLAITGWNILSTLTLGVQ